MFLSTFKWEARKGWDVLLGAYLAEFTAADDVEVGACPAMSCWAGRALGAAPAGSAGAQYTRSAAGRHRSCTRCPRCWPMGCWCRMLA